MIAKNREGATPFPEILTRYYKIVIQSTFRMTDVYLHAKKSTSSLTSFFLYWKDIANMLFWEFWECLTIPIKNHGINFEHAFMFVCMQKINFLTHFFLKILQRNPDFLFWVMWVYKDITIDPKWVINLYTSNFHRMPKINIILYFFLEILHFD